jgi:hypothetical protein
MAQREQERERLRRRVQVAPDPMEVVLEDQTFDDLRARRGRAQAFLAHRFAQLLVLDQLSGAFHGRKERRLGIYRAGGLVWVAPHSTSRAHLSLSLIGTRLGESRSRRPCRRPAATPARSLTRPRSLKRFALDA